MKTMKSRILPLMLGALALGSGVSDHPEPRRPYKPQVKQAYFTPKEWKKRKAKKRAQNRSRQINRAA